MHRDPEVVILAFGWASSDQRKWNNTFGPGTGRAAFGSFCDMQVIPPGDTSRWSPQDPRKTLIVTHNSVNQVGHRDMT